MLAAAAEISNLMMEIICRVKIDNANERRASRKATGPADQGPTTTAGHEWAIISTEGPS